MKIYNSFLFLLIISFICTNCKKEKETTSVITLKKPNGGETWILNSSDTVRWTSQGVEGDIKIDLSIDGGTNWSPLINNTPNDGSEIITVPNTPSTTCKIRISTTTGTLSDISNSKFTIQPPGITITTPNGGESWLIASLATIQWTSLGVNGNVNIELSTDEGTNWTTLVSNTANDGTESILVPNSSSTKCKIRVSSTDNIYSDASNNLFSMELLSWAPPVLSNPIEAHVNNSNCNLTLLADQDYKIIFDEKITAAYGLRINCNGARNILIIGGEIDIPDQGTWVSGEDFGQKRRAMYIHKWTGVLHIEGVWFHGADIAEGLNIDSRFSGSTLQVQNCRFDNIKGRQEESANYSSAKWHPDIIQGWGGPTYFYIDYLTGTTEYQAFMLQPNQYGAYPISKLDFNHINIYKTSSQGYTIYESSGVNGQTLSNFYISPEGRPKGFPTSDPAWNSILEGVPMNGDFVIANTTGGVNIAGMNYISPGYK